MDSIVKEKIRERDSLIESEDSLGHHHLAEHLLDYILSKTFPISVGIYGKWGSGKSVLVNFIKQYAEQKKIAVRVYDVFDFGSNVAQELTQRIVRQNIRVYLLYFITQWPVMIVSFGLLGIYFFIDKQTGLLLGLIPIFSSILTKVLASINDRFLKYEFLDRQIIVIDNLDRLSPKNTILFLEKMKTVLLKRGVLWSDRFAYVIPCDFDILQSEVKELYKNKSADVRDYLNKLIEVSFLVPTYRHDLTEGFVGSLLNQDIPSDVRGRISNIFEQSIIVDTPRDIKNFLMELDMVFIVAKARNQWSEEFLIANLDKILAVHMLRSVFPQLYQFIKLLSEREVYADPFQFVDEFRNSLYAPEVGNTGFKEISERNRFESLRHIFWNVVKIFLPHGPLTTKESRKKEKEEFFELIKIVDSSTQSLKIEISETIKVA